MPCFSSRLHIVIQHNKRFISSAQNQIYSQLYKLPLCSWQGAANFSTRKFLVRSSQGRKCQFDTTSTLTAVREHKCSLRFGDGAFDFNTDHRWCQPCSPHLSCLLRREHRRPSPTSHFRLMLLREKWGDWEREREKVSERLADNKVAV